MVLYLQSERGDVNKSHVEWMVIDQKTGTVVISYSHSQSFLPNKRFPYNNTEKIKYWVFEVRRQYYTILIY